MSLMLMPSIVSIHASVKDATQDQRQHALRMPVSIHASVKDATGFCISSSSSCICFNPRICKRCDRYRVNTSKDLVCFNPRICKRCDCVFGYKNRLYHVSIHASVKDATNFHLTMYHSPLGFNPRICKRCDAALVVMRSQ